MAPMNSSEATIQANRPLPRDPNVVREHFAALASGVAAMVIDTGQPVDVPPPIVEPVGFDEPPRPPIAGLQGRRPPRRSFLAPPAPPLQAANAEPAPPPAAPLAVAGLRPVLLPATAPPPAPLAELHGTSSAEGRWQIAGRIRAVGGRWRANAPAAPTLAPEAVAPAVAATPRQSASPPEPSALVPPQPELGELRGAPPKAAWRIPAWLQGVGRRWREVAAAATPRGRILYWAPWAVGALAVVAIVYLAGIGPFSHPAPMQHAPAPLAGLPSDPAQRLAYLQSAAAGGNAEAQLQLAILYAKGEGVTQDYATAAKWFRAAADQGLPRAQYDMGVLYERGRGVTADAEQAVSWYLKAAQGKYPLAEYNLAVAYTKGVGARKDLTEAALWYRRAAGQGVVLAMVNLATLYERGEGVAASPVDAYAWYMAAGQRGNRDAARRAEDLFNGLSHLDQIRAETLASDIAGSIHDVAPDSRGVPTG